MGFRFVCRRADQVFPGQDRLQILLLAECHYPAIEASLDTLTAQGPLNRFYDFEPCEPPAPVPEQSIGAYQVLRRESIIKPSLTVEQNDRIPPAYYTIASFTPNQRNDYRRLDRILSQVREEVVIDIRVEPVDITAERDHHTRLLSLLQQVNRTWDETPWSSRRAQNREWADSLDTTRQKDPMADHALRLQQRFHQTLLEPALKFSVRVLAETVESARLIASILAESAFEKGTYSLVAAIPESPVHVEGDHE